MREKDAVSALKEFQEVLNTHEVEFWLESGTLLGAIREKSFISWDFDMDLGTWEKYGNKMKILGEEFSKRGYETYFSLYHNLLTIKKGGIDIQLVFWRKQNDRAVAPLRYIENRLGFFLSAVTWAILFSQSGKMHREQIDSFTKKFQYFSSRIANKVPEALRLNIAELFRSIAVQTGNRRGLVVTPSHYFENLTKIEFYNSLVNVPSEAESYLEFYYGSDWRTPKKEWNYVRKDRKLISKTERIGEKWDYYPIRDNPYIKIGRIIHK